MKFLKLSLIALVLAFTFACADDTEENTDAPVLSLTKNGANTSFNQTFEFNSKTVADVDQELILNIKSTAVGGVQSLMVDMWSDNESLQEEFDLVTPLDLADINYNELIFVIYALLPEALQLKHASNVSVNLSDLVDNAFAVISDNLPLVTDNTSNDNVTLGFTLVDANGTTKQTLNVNMVLDNTTLATANIGFYDIDGSGYMGYAQLTMEQLTSGNTQYDVDAIITGATPTTKINRAYISIVANSADGSPIVNNIVTSYYTNKYLVHGIDLFDANVMSDLGLTPEVKGTTDTIRFNINELIIALLAKVKEAGYQDEIDNIEAFNISISSGNTLHNVTGNQLTISPAPQPQ